MTWYSRIIRRHRTARLYGAGLVTVGLVAGGLFLRQTLNQIYAGQSPILFARGGLALSAMFIWVGSIHLLVGSRAPRYLQIDPQQPPTRLQQLTTLIGVFCCLMGAVGIEIVLMMRYGLSSLR